MPARIQHIKIRGKLHITGPNRDPDEPLLHVDHVVFEGERAGIQWEITGSSMQAAVKNAS